LSPSETHRYHETYSLGLDSGLFNSGIGFAARESELAYPELNYSCLFGKFTPLVRGGTRGLGRVAALLMLLAGAGLPGSGHAAATSLPASARAATAAGPATSTTPTTPTRESLI
jgi:hypothetical protein